MGSAALRASAVRSHLAAAAICLRTPLQPGRPGFSRLQPPVSQPVEAGSLGQNIFLWFNQGDCVVNFVS